MTKTGVEICTSGMRECFAAALAQARLRKAPKSQIFNLLTSAISTLQTLLYSDEDCAKEGKEPLLSNDEAIRLIKEARVAFNLVIDEQLAALEVSEQEVSTSDYPVLIEEWYSNIQNDWKDFLKLHKDLIVGLVGMYNARFKSSEDIPP